MYEIDTPAAERSLARNCMARSADSLIAFFMSIGTYGFVCESNFITRPNASRIRAVTSASDGSHMASMSLNGMRLRNSLFFSRSKAPQPPSLFYIPSIHSMARRTASEPTDWGSFLTKARTAAAVSSTSGVQTLHYSKLNPPGLSFGLRIFQSPCDPRIWR